jgi:hypothetical protein
VSAPVYPKLSFFAWRRRPTTECNSERDAVQDAFDDAEGIHEDEPTQNFTYNTVSSPSDKDPHTKVVKGQHEQTNVSDGTTAATSSHALTAANLLALKKSYNSTTANGIDADAFTQRGRVDETCRNMGVKAAESCLPNTHAGKSPIACWISSSCDPGVGFHCPCRGRN